VGESETKREKRNAGYVLEKARLRKGKAGDLVGAKTGSEMKTSLFYLRRGEGGPPDGKGYRSRTEFR